MGRRRQETLWIHRWSRWLIGAIALIGAAETAYLTVIKFMGDGAACPTEGCDRVLASAYATVFGLPLPLFGFLAYGAMAVLALGPLGIRSEGHKDRRQQLETTSWWLLFVVSLTMVVFSGYLMYVMAFEIQAVCVYCIGSALFTLTMLSLTLLGRRWKDMGQLLFIGLIVAIIALVGTLAVYAPITGGGSAPTTSAAGETGPPITTTSGAAEMALAQHLDDTGAKMYGAWWCSHCHDQKQLFGQTAAKEIPYVECDPEGVTPQTALCRSQDAVTGFPTWEINGKFYPGVQPLEALARLSGYSGPDDFQN
ncbi:Vitamin K epoxide reductase [Halomicronema hongdechloris C2206]|uniref:Vitamin K epoxide reductase n=1 Tax=Halomicronema hongdechloris C2206 TaxID=1641165 RepID=A0A1Z3HKQ6_9CYAN|nr:vitamin K epoxide reductase family protein [Halomicronema hongdechloris]ASC70891.1 Vitamin K epoxide reductase [Halomicronema hongdechloris C2206]